MVSNTNIKLKDRYQFVLTELNGVDFSSSPFLVPKSRATNMRNFIKKDGTNCKRNGWKEVLNISINGIPKKINYLFKYTYYGQNQMIAYAGARFYKIDIDNQGKYYLTDITETSTYSNAVINTSILQDEKIQVFYQNKKAYIIGCGDYLVYGSWNDGQTFELRRVAFNEDVYIPTTTISIDKDGVLDVVRETYEDINILTSLRKNELVGTSEIGATWTVDSEKIDENTDVKIELTIPEYEEEPVVDKVIQNNGVDKTKLYDIENNEVGSINFASGKITLNIITAVEVPDTTSTEENPSYQEYGSMVVTFNYTQTGKFTSDLITKCKFGTLFGSNGNANRIFLSGNEEYKNYDFHSFINDYTYFGAEMTSVVGSDASAIVGYERMDDKTLVIFKASHGIEPSIFYRTGYEQQEVDDNGNLIGYTEVFPLQAGSIGEAIISRHAIANLAGDHLILSRNGVYGLVLSNNVATAERISRERSRTINAKLTLEENLKDSVAIVYNNMYILCVNSNCYVADARYKYTAETDMDDTFNYEWWFWDNIPAHCFIEMDGELYFGTKDGKICKFDDHYTDRTLFSSEAGDLTLDTLDNKIVFNTNLNSALKNNMSVKFFDDDLFSLLLENAVVENNKIITTANFILKLANNVELYVDKVGNSGLSLNTKYYTTNVNLDEFSFQLKNEAGEIIYIAGGGFDIVKNVVAKELFITNISFQDSTFQVKEYIVDEEPLNLVNYNNNLPLFLIMQIFIPQNVVAEWYSPIFDFGTNAQAKTLLQQTIYAEGELDFGYDTNFVSKLSQASTSKTFSFDNIDFTDFAFANGFATSYTIKTLQRNFNFIIFRFVSDSDTSCSIHSYGAIYKFNKKNKGVA